MTTPDFGLTLTTQNDEIRPAVEADLSTVGIVFTAPNANTTTFPDNTAVRMNSLDALIADLGDTDGVVTGSILGQIDILNANLEGRSADLVLVRRDEGVDEAATMTALIEGLATLRDSAAETGVTPGIVIVPGYTNQQDTPTTANAVVAALPGILDSMEAHAIVSGGYGSSTAFISYRETMSSKRLIPMAVQVKYGTTPDTIDAAGAVAGMLVARDAENLGRPFSSAANRPMQGIVGPNRAIPFSLIDGATEGQVILANDGGVVIKGERGARGAIADGGFVFIGYATAAADDLNRFYNQTRAQDWINITVRRTCAFFLGRYNVTPRTVDLIIQTVNGILDNLVADNLLLGYEVSFDTDKNSPENLRLGRIRVGYRQEPPPTLIRLDLETGRYREAISAAFQDIVVTG